MFTTIIGDDWDVIDYIFHGWNLVSKTPKLNGQFEYVLKLA